MKLASPGCNPQAAKLEKVTVTLANLQEDVASIINSQNAKSGGSGRASVESPAQITVRDGRCEARIVWSSKNYDYMKVSGIRYDAAIVDGHSVFTVPVASLEEPFPVVADTVAMSTPHEIEYTITCDAATLAADPA